MMITLNTDELKSLKPETQADLLAFLAGTATLPTVVPEPAAPAPLLPPGMDPLVARDFDWENVADLSFKQIQTWMEAAQERTKLGLRFIAEHGPIVEATALIAAGIDNLPHFQSRTTIRTRTVTGDRNAYLFAWDDWTYDDGKVETGRYAVTPTTHQALRRYFSLA